MSYFVLLWIYFNKFYIYLTLLYLVRDVYFQSVEFNCRKTIFNVLITRALNFVTQKSGGVTHPINSDTNGICHLFLRLLKYTEV